jgi:hypothetical protein
MQLKKFLSICFIFTFTAFVVGRNNADGAIILSENFEGGTAGSSVSSPGTVFGAPGLANVAIGNSNSGNFAQVVADTVPVFASSNQYLRFEDNTTSGTPAITAALSSPISGTAMQMAFDFYDPVIAGETSTIRINLNNDGAANTTAARSVTLTFANGSVSDELGTQSGVVSSDTKHSAILVGNFSGAVVNYGYLNAYTVDPGKLDLWIDGVLVQNDVSFRNPGLTTATHIRIYSGSTTNKASLNLDNIEIQDSVVTAVPEPSTCFAVGLSLIGLVAMRRKK